MLEKTKNETAGKSRIVQFEQAVKDMIADRILPEDFEIKEIGEDYSWGMSDEIAVVWYSNGNAYKCDYNTSGEYSFLYWDEEEQKAVMRTGRYFYIEPEFNIYYAEQEEDL